MATAQRDSELAHSFGPHEFGFDFLPLEAPQPGVASLATSPTPHIPAIDLAGDGPLPPLAEPLALPVVAASGNHSPLRQLAKGRAAGEIWLAGDSIFCACPDCQAPMSIRIWLMVADCWRCGASIELSQEQEREVQRLLAEREPPVPATVAPAARPPEPPAPRFKKPLVAVPAAPPPAPAARSERPAPPPQPSVARRAAAAQQALRREPWIRRFVNETPAWLISMLIHLVLLTLLALLTTAIEPEEDPFITLSTMTRRVVKEGDDPIHIPPEDLAQFDLPLSNKADLLDDRKREALLAAAQDARELRLDNDAPNLPDFELVKQKVGRADGYEQALLARDPRLRVEMVEREGGTTLTEAAVARGLRWLANHQNKDGSWSLSGFRHAGDCNCRGDGAFDGKAPGTALAMLPYLGAGQTHLAGKYKGTVGRGLRWLIENQKEDGDLRAGSTGNEGMYTHGQAAIVLCEAFAMTGDEQLRLPAQKAIDFIVKAQYRDGGWRYQPSPRSQTGDTSVVGWQLMALQSARSANLTVPDETWGMADLFLDSVQHDDGSKYSYQARGGPTEVMTAEALLCRMYLGWTKDRPGLVQGVEWLAAEHLPEVQHPNIYYWYYGTQVMHHYGGPEWEAWNLQMRDVLCSTQETQGHIAGSWAPRGDHAGAGGRIYVTALSICTLEVYYRHLPVFRQIEL
ncbi:MAG: prenyltransferase/squalene oxidase repeat-containing protein [Pirellulaceae bacterium]